MSESIFEQNKHGTKTRMCVRKLQNSWPKILLKLCMLSNVRLCATDHQEHWVWPCAPFDQWDIIWQKQRLTDWGLLSFYSMEPCNYHHVDEPRLTCQMMREKWSSPQLTLHQPPNMRMRPSRPSRTEKDKRNAHSALKMVRNNFKPPTILWRFLFVSVLQQKNWYRYVQTFRKNYICFYSQTDFYHTVWQTLYHSPQGHNIRKMTWPINTIYNSTLSSKFSCNQHGYR